MFWAPLSPSSGAHDDSVGYHIGRLPVTAFGPETHPSCLHLTSIQQQLENQMAYVVTNTIIVSS